MKKMTVIIVLVIVLVVVVFPLYLRSPSNRIPKSPVDDLGSVWVCEEPYIWFEACDDDWGRTGIGEVETEDGEKLAVRFFMERGSYYIYPESAFKDIDEYDDPYLRYPTEPCIMSGVYTINRKGTEVKLNPSLGDDEIYHDKYRPFTFYRQDPAGTEATAVQP